MGLFDWFDPQEPDETLLEIGNDDGEHVVISIPTTEETSVENLFKSGHIACDQDEQIYRAPISNERRIAIAQHRDHSEYRFRLSRVFDPNEDLEEEVKEAWIQPATSYKEKDNKKSI